MRIVDWEYAGMGDRFFDLGNLSVNNGFAEARRRARCSPPTSASRRTPRRFAALRLMRIMSDFREGMWGVVQTAISALDFDFAAYADEHLTRVVAAGLADPRFATWLEDARGVAVTCPRRARCVIIGGGVGGTSIAYHLAELGWRDVVLLDRASSRAARRSTPRASSASCARRSR